MWWTSNTYELAERQGKTQRALDATFSQFQEGTMTKYDQQFVQNLYNTYKSEIDIELATLSALNNYSGATPQQLEEVVERTVGRHAPELYEQALLASGKAADLSKLPPSFLKEMDARGCTQQGIVDFACKYYQHLPPAEAVAKWTENASRLPANLDLRMGEPETFYDPGRSRPQEGG